VVKNFWRQWDWFIWLTITGSALVLMALWKNAPLQPRVRQDPTVIIIQNFPSK